MKSYGLKESWDDAEDFMTKIALKTGRLLKGGEPDINSVSRIILNDFQRGKLPYFTTPPGCDQKDVGPDDEARFFLLSF